jgi:tRNA uridine 5-carbamoylmethylation protein Kti12
VSSKFSSDYKLSNDFNKIIQIIDQYRAKYSRDLSSTTKSCKYLNSIKDELTRNIVSFYEKVNQQDDVSEWKEEVIVLDYLVTLRQLVGLLQNYDL